MSEPFVQVAVRITLPSSFDRDSGSASVSVEELEKVLLEQRSAGLTPVYLEIETGYESGDEDLVLVCRRPETDEERDTRVALAAQRAEERENSERHQYEKLKKKFEKESK